MKLFGGRVAGVGSRESGVQAAPGSVVAVGEVLRVACGDGVVEVSDVQPAGKERMAAKALAIGRGVAVGDVLA